MGLVLGAQLLSLSPEVIVSKIDLKVSRVRVYPITSEDHASQILLKHYILVRNDFPLLNVININTFCQFEQRVFNRGVGAVIQQLDQVHQNFMRYGRLR